MPPRGDDVLEEGLVLSPAEGLGDVGPGKLNRYRELYVGCTSWAAESACRSV